MMYCAQCGSKKERLSHGAWPVCCDGIGYWFDQPPLEADLWFDITTEYNGFWFYRTIKWPLGMKPTKPRIENA